MKYLFYGNCQTRALQKLMNLEFSRYVACYESEITDNEFTDIILDSDVIITQHINQNYRDKNYLSTDYIMNIKRPDTKIIIFDSLHFSFYHFDTEYKMLDDKQIIDEPIHYHYNKMVEFYKSNRSVNDFLNCVVENKDFKTKFEMETILNECITNLKDRYQRNINKYDDENNCYVVSAHKYIEDNFKYKLLFYSFNHPSYHVLEFIAKKVCNILDISPKLLDNFDPLSNPCCILYKCITHLVEFDLDVYKSQIDDIFGDTSVTQHYYDVYDKNNTFSKSNNRNIISLGHNCAVANCAKNIGKRIIAGPFDWTLTNIESLTHILKDNFDTFMNKNLIRHCDVSWQDKKKCCVHDVYGKDCQDGIFFPHKNLLFATDYSYYQRCIERFHHLNTNDFMYVRFDYAKFLHNHEKEQLVETYEKLHENLGKMKYLLCICYDLSHESKFVEILNKTNLVVIRLYTTSVNDGARFANKEDQILFERILLKFSNSCVVSNEQNSEL